MVNAGLLLPATLAPHLGLSQLVQEHLDLGDAPGRANTARAAAHFLRETVGRVRYGGASGQLTMRADSGFYTHAVAAVCRKLEVRFSITIRQRASLRDLIEAIPEDAWTPIPYWMDGAADVVETPYTPFQSEPDAAPVRLIVRRVKPAPGSQLALFATYSYHGFITGRNGETLELEADHRRHAEIENAIRDLKYGAGLNHLPSGRFAANGAWLAVQVMAHNLARWTARIGLGEQIVTTKTLRRRVFALAGRITRSARRITLHLPKRWPWEEQFSRALARLRAIPLPARRRPSATDPPANPTSPPTRATPVRERLLLRPLSSSCPPAPIADRHWRPQKRLQTPRQPPVYPNSSLEHRPCNFLTPLPLSSRHPSVSIGGFGFRFQSGGGPSRLCPPRASPGWSSRKGLSSRTCRCDPRSQGSGFVVRGSGKSAGSLMLSCRRQGSWQFPDLPSSFSIPKPPLPSVSFTSPTFRGFVHLAAPANSEPPTLENFVDYELYHFGTVNF